MLEKKEELRCQECNSHWFCIASPYWQVYWNVDMEEDNERLNGTQNYSENDKIPCKYIHIPVFVPVFFGRGNSPPQPKKTYNPPNGCQIVRNVIYRLAFKTPINTQDPPLPLRNNCFNPARSYCSLIGYCSELLDANFTSCFMSTSI